MVQKVVECCRTSGRLHHYVRDGDNTLLILGGVGNELSKPTPEFVPTSDFTTPEDVVNWMF